MWYCKQPAITDAAFVHLRGIHTLVIEGCSQATITGTTFYFLQRISMLVVRDCSAAAIATARSLGLPVRTQGGVWGALTHVIWA
jgi:hypothetical protein